MVNNTELIVLHLTKTGDKSLVLHTLSRDYGRRAFFLKGIGRKNQMSLFLPLGILEAEVRENTSSYLFQVCNPVSAEALNGLRNDMYKNAITMFLSEVLFKVIKEGANEDGLYSWCRSRIILLDRMEGNFSNFHIYFLLELAAILGFAPSRASLSPFMAGNESAMCDFLILPFEEVMMKPLSGEIRNSMSEAVLKYISYHSDSTFNIHSLKILRALFAE